MRIFVAMGASLLAFWQAHPLAANEVDPADHYEIVVSYKTETKGDVSSSSSSGRTTYTERVLSSDDDCMVQVFDWQDDPDRERPLAQWEMPAQVSVCRTGTRNLANVPEMEARLQQFLNAIKVTREQCGKHYVTWNVFKIECDPQTALETIDYIDLAIIPLTDGARYAVPGGAGPVILEQISRDKKGTIWEGEVAVDPAYLREQAAQTNVVVGEIMGEPVSLEEALAALQGQTYSGLIQLRFEADPGMQEITRTLEANVRVIDANGGTEERSATEITQRRTAGR